MLVGKILQAAYQLEIDHMLSSWTASTENIHWEELNEKPLWTIWFLQVYKTPPQQ